MSVGKRALPSSFMGKHTKETLARVSVRRGSVGTLRALDESNAKLKEMPMKDFQPGIKFAQF